jgi:hypothetical protein
VPRATFDYLASLEWIRARENLVLVGPAGTGKSHLLVALGLAAVEAGIRVRYFAAVELVETLYRGLADNSVGRVIEGILRADLGIVDELGFAPLDDVGTQLLFRLRGGRLRAPLAGCRQPLAVRVLGPFPARAHHRRVAPRPAAPSRLGGRHRGRELPHARGSLERRGRSPSA